LVHVREKQVAFDLNGHAAPFERDNSIVAFSRRVTLVVICFTTSTSEAHFS
jgi:hypothetical protein